MYNSKSDKQDGPSHQKLVASCSQLFVTGMILQHSRTFIYFVRIKNIMVISRIF
jgi:hypothetical protein